MAKSWIEKLNSYNPKHGIIKQCPDIGLTVVTSFPLNLIPLVQSIQFGTVVTIGNLKIKVG